MHISTCALLQLQIKADSTVTVTASYRVARGLTPAVKCGMSILVDVDMSTTDAADLCTTNAAKKVNKHNCIQ
jgi:hypothetical protein